MKDLRQRLYDDESLDVSEVTEVNVYIQSVFMGYVVGREIQVESSNSIFAVISELHSKLPEIHQKKFRPEELQLFINLQSVSEDEMFFDVYHPETDKGKVEIEDK
ncbi:hypothetical protein IWW36_002536 [Coemansia brasiliensis]|uniref:Uncharacterized protein n=1 Tax=Coemansia brasiliensis TaxID=2650707 RepID=A0A9W8ID98_9FUNG|nr:hypothetical protein IWW36_002536 [Coemansia brasiliensis]